MKKARKQGAVALVARLMMTAVLFCCWHASTSVRADTGDALTVDMVFVLDNSGSMAKHDPDFITRRVVMDFIRSVGASFRIGMVVFDADARLVESLTPVAAPETTRRYRQALEAVNYGGQLTNTAAGVERALYELKANGRHDAQKVMLLLTDGIIDTGSAQKDAESERWLKEGLTLESRELDVHIFGVAFTENADFRLMQTLAVQTGGEYFRALTPDDIQRIFETVLEIVSRPPAGPDETVENPVPVPPAAAADTAPASPDAAPDEKAPPPATADNRAAADPVGPSVWPLLVAGLIAVVLLALLAVLLKNKKSRTDKPGLATEPAIVNGADGSEAMPHAELIDAENVISDESITLTLNKKVVRIGRDRLNDIVIPQDSISSLHATIQFRNGYFYLEDQRSTNGTRLNGAVIRENRPIRLKSGDKIHFAVFEFRFLMEDMAPYGETVMLDSKLASDTKS